MKKILLPFLIWVTVVTANEPTKTKFLTLTPFCVNCELKQDITIADTWYIPTGSIIGNPLLGQFQKVDSRPLEQIALTQSQVDEFISKYGKTYLREGIGNYFLVQEGKKFYFVSIERTKTGSFIPRKEFNTISIPATDKEFINIFVAKNINQK